MKHSMRAILTLAAVLGAMFVAAPALCATPIDQVRPLDARGRLHVENVRGLIDVRAWNRPEVKIEGSLGKGVEKLEVSGDRANLRIVVRYPQRRGLLQFATGGADVEPTNLRLTVPIRADLDLSAVSADVVAWGVSPSELKIDNVSGKTTVAAAADHIDISSVSGDVEVTADRANLDVETVSGAVRLRGRLGQQIGVETVSGDVRVDVLDTAIKRMSGKTVSGAMDLRIAIAPRARVSLESVSGDIDLHLPRNASADVRAESFSGSLRAPGAKVERPDHGPGSTLRGRYGQGDAEVTIETFSGDAELKLD